MEETIARSEGEGEPRAGTRRPARHVPATRHSQQAAHAPAGVALALRQVHGHDAARRARAGTWLDGGESRDPLVRLGLGGTEVQSHAELRLLESDAQDVTSMFDAMLALSVIISIFGVVNTLALSVCSSGHARSDCSEQSAPRGARCTMVHAEGILAAIGATLGLALGFLAGLADRGRQGCAVVSVPYGAARW